jgi:hypothetical protein
MTPTASQGTTDGAESGVARTPRATRTGRTSSQWRQLLLAAYRDPEPVAGALVALSLVIGTAVAATRR